MRNRAVAIPEPAAAAAVCGFWWLATGLAFAMRADDRARLVTGVLATTLAIVGAWLIAATRHHRSPAAALMAFLGAALVWGWVEALYFGGWVTGLAPGAPAGPAGSLALALQAIAATLYNDTLALLVIAGVALATDRANNRTALATLVLFWASHQVARLNLFAGVPHSAAELLPSHLKYLTMFFGPEHASAFLVASIAVFAALTLWLAWRAVRARDPYRRQVSTLLGTLACLAVVEYVALGAGALPLWASFLPRS